LFERGSCLVKSALLDSDPSKGIERHCLAVPIAQLSVETALLSIGDT
jgi:hypothetical protein